jgi:hypothetical protein
MHGSPSLRGRSAGDKFNMSYTFDGHVITNMCCVAGDQQQLSVERECCKNRTQFPICEVTSNY